MDSDIETVKYCYTCLSSDTSLISLFNSGMDIILQCTLNIMPSFDNTFNWICYKCRALLRNFEKFRLSCLRTDSFIKKYIIDPNEYVDSLKENNDYFNLTTTNVFYIDSISDISCNDQNNYFYINSSDSLENNTENSFFNQNECLESSPIIKNEFDYNEFDSNTISESSTKKIKLKKKKHKKKSFDDFHVYKNENIETDSISTSKKTRSNIIGNRLSINKSKLLKIYLTEDEQKSERQKRMNEEKYLNAPFRCELCVIPFRREFTLQNHMEKHSEDRGPYVCSICQQRFGNERQFKMHTSIHSIRLVCYACGAQLRDRGRLADHLAWHAGHKYPCKMCNATFICRTTLNNHIRVKHKDNEYKCEFCGRIFKVKERLKEHESRHSKSPAYSCNICNKQFYSAANLSNHKVTHSTIRHYYCVECDLYFKSASILKNHLEKSRKHIDPSLLQYPCDQCNKRFRTSDLLTHHIDATHLKRKKFSCEICSASYASHQGLNFHRRLAHQGFRLPKSHTCTICERSFTAKALLTNHLRVHTGEKPFECSECFRKFSQKSSLRTHIKLVHLKLKRVIKKKLKSNNQTKIQETDESNGISGVCVDKIEMLNLYPEEVKSWECKSTDNSHVQQEMIEDVCDISVPINIEHALYDASPR